MCCGHLMQTSFRSWSSKLLRNIFFSNSHPYGTLLIAETEVSRWDMIRKSLSSNVISYQLKWLFCVSLYVDSNKITVQSTILHYSTSNLKQQILDVHNFVFSTAVFSPSRVYETPRAGSEAPFTVGTMSGYNGAMAPEHTGLTTGLVRSCVQIY